MKITKKIILLGALCCTISLSAFADTLQPAASPAATASSPSAKPNTTAATQPTTDPSEVSSNQPIKQYNSDHCARKVCSRTDFGDVTCKCPTGIQTTK